MAKLVTLEAWAHDQYGEDSPHINTLRRWARDGLITPLPEKHGRTYYVRPDACYSDYRVIPQRLQAPIHSGTGGRLVDRIHR